MRSKRTQKSSSIGTRKSASNGREARDMLGAEEAARREAERKYRDIFENAVEGVFQTSPDGGFITANPALARMLGFETPEELIRAREIEGSYYVHPERRVEFKRLLDQYDTVQGFEFEAYRKDGTKVWMSDNVRAVRDASGGLLYYEGTVEDITERKGMEASLRRSELDLADFFENAAMGLHWVDSDGTVLRVNQAELDLLGYTRDECIGHNIAEFHADRSVVEDILKRLRAGEVLRDYEARLRCKDGSIRQVCINSSVSWEEGRFVHSRCFTRDITEHKRAEELLKQSQSQLAEAQHLANVGSFTWDLRTNQRTGSGELYRIFGLDADMPAPSLDTALTESVHPDDRDLVSTAVNASIASGQPCSFSYRVIRPDGVERIIHSRGHVVADSNGHPIRMFGTAQDVTEQKLAESALLQAEQKYRDIFENAMEGIFQTTADGRTITANPALARMLGFASAVELIASRTNIGEQGYVDPARRAEFKRLLDQHDTVQGFEFECYRKDGTKIWMSDNVRAVRDASGRLLYYEGTVEDVSERKRVEESLREAQARGESVLASIADAHILFDHDWRCIYVNHAAVRAIGWPREQILQSTLWELYPDIIGTDLDRQYRRAMDGRGTPAFDFHYPTLDSWWEHRFYPLPEGLAVFATDITDRKRAEEALRKSEERYRELFDNDKDAIYVHDLNGVYTSVNRAAESLSGYSREEILGKHFRDFVPPEYLRQLGECFGKKLEETGETNYEVEIIKRDGTRVPVEVSSRLVYENGVAVGVQGSVRDITERKRAQQALLTYSRRLREAQEAERGRIARELHDQIGQMLTALKLNLHAIQDAGDAGEARALIEDNLKMLDEALEQVRDLSVDLRPLLLDDLGLVTALHWFVDHQAQRTGVRSEFISDSLDPDLRFSAELETACFRIAQEALTNVARHARAKTVTVRLSRNRDYLILLIEDDGVGFDLEALQGHAVASATLGLRGMEERAHAMGGRLKIDSATDKGTQVFVELPIAMPNGARPRIKKE